MIYNVTHFLHNSALYSAVQRYLRENSRITQTANTRIRKVLHSSPHSLWWWSSFFPDVASYMYMHVQSTLRITTLGGASEKCPYLRSVLISEVSLYALQLDRNLLWAWKFCRYSRNVVISVVVISEVDCISVPYCCDGKNT